MSFVDVRGNLRRNVRKGAIEESIRDGNDSISSSIELFSLFLFFSFEATMLLDWLEFSLPVFAGLFFDVAIILV
jgi:hypothetical protein